MAGVRTGDVTSSPEPEQQSRRQPAQPGLRHCQKHPRAQPEQRSSQPEEQPVPGFQQPEEQRAEESPCFPASRRRTASAPQPARQEQFSFSSIGTPKRSENGKEDDPNFTFRDSGARAAAVNSIGSAGE